MYLETFASAAVEGQWWWIWRKSHCHICHTIPDLLVFLSDKLWILVLEDLTLRKHLWNNFLQFVHRTKKVVGYRKKDWDDFHKLFKCCIAYLKPTGRLRWFSEALQMLYCLFETFIMDVNVQVEITDYFIPKQCKSPPGWCGPEWSPKWSWGGYQTPPS